MAIKITIFSSYRFQQNNNFRQEFPYILYIYSTDYSAMRLSSHSLSQAIPKLYFFIAWYLKGEIVQNLLTYLKKKNKKKNNNNNNNNNSNSSKNVVGILAVLMACI